MKLLAAFIFNGSPNRGLAQRHNYPLILWKSVFPSSEGKNYTHCDGAKNHPPLLVTVEGVTYFSGAVGGVARHTRSVCWCKWGWIRTSENPALQRDGIYRVDGWCLTPSDY